MDRKREQARRSLAARRARKKSLAWLTSVDKYSTEREREWARGTFWAGVGVALTFGPMLALGFVWGWL